MNTLKIKNQSHFPKLHLHRKTTLHKTVSTAFMTKACQNKFTALTLLHLGAGNLQILTQFMEQSERCSTYLLKPLPSTPFCSFRRINFSPSPTDLPITPYRQTVPPQYSVKCPEIASLDKQKKKPKCYNQTFMAWFCKIVHKNLC